MSASSILVSVDPYETRAAVFENEQLVELFQQSNLRKNLIANIYKGVVTSVIPGLEAAFVDIGIGRNAFLHVRDLVCKPTSPWDADQENEVDQNNEEEDLDLQPQIHRPQFPYPDFHINDYINEGQTLIVQMEKEPLGQKGCRITAHCSLAGRYLVLFPSLRHVGISRRIQDEDERQRLLELGTELTAEQCGLIIRTAAAGSAPEAIRNEFEMLRQRWQEIEQIGQTSSAPALLYEDKGMIHQVIRDFCSVNTREVLVEGEDAYRQVKGFASHFLPGWESHVRYYDEPVPLFRARGIDAEIERLLQKRVWLKSGGYLVIDETEALTVVDVNTGRDLGRSNLEETAFATNLEATREIARQLRLRDLGGIVVVDFIDMLSPRNQKVIVEQFAEALAMDRSHPTLFSMTELGLVQLTRKRVRKSLLKSLSRPCPYCRGEGIVFSQTTMVTRILRHLEELLLEDPRDRVVLKVHPSLAEEINANWSDHLEKLSARFEAKARVVADPNLHYHDIAESFEMEAN